MTVDITSIDTGDSERDSLLLSAEMFDAQQWPQARFVTTTFEKISADQYSANAKLTIRDTSQKIIFPFKVRFSQQGNKKMLHLTSELRINRLDFGVGQGEWQETLWVADKVTVKVNLHAYQTLGADHFKESLGTVTK